MVEVALWAVAAYALSVFVLAVVMPWMEAQHKDRADWLRRLREEELRRKRDRQPNVPRWVQHGLALIRSANAMDIVDDIASVQPMPKGLGAIHYLDLRYGRPLVATPAAEEAEHVLRIWTREYGAIRERRNAALEACAAALTGDVREQAQQAS